MVKPDWEQILSNTGGYIQRTRTPTGWLVREVVDVAHVRDGNIVTGYDWRVGMVFVPDPDHVWLMESSDEILAEVNHLQAYTLEQLKGCWDTFLKNNATRYVDNEYSPPIIITIEQVRDELNQRGEGDYCHGH